MAGLRRGVLVSLVLFGLLGCASYKPAKKDKDLAMQDLHEEGIVARGNSLEVRLLPLFQKLQARKYVGIDPPQSGLMPAILTVCNTGTEIVKVDLLASYLVTNADAHWQGLALDEAIDRALRSDAEVIVWDFVLGPVAMFAAMDHVTAVNRTLEEDYHARYFRPTLINGGQAGGGMIFFNRPTIEKVHIRSAVIVVSVVDTGETMEITIALPQDVAD